MIPGREAVLVGRGPTVHQKGLDPGVDDPRQRVAAQVRAYIASANNPGAADRLYLCRWWHDHGKKNYPDLLASVRVLLSPPQETLG